MDAVNADIKEYLAKIEALNGRNEQLNERLLAAE
jgi:hypothetical protein